jgi:type 1 glutamine amidotransferase
MPRTMPEADQANFLHTLAAGKGLVVLHHALCAYQGWPEYRRVTGGCYFTVEEEFAGKRWPKSTYHHDLSLRVTVADPSHPVTRGVSNFQIVDEAYGGCWVSPDVHPLLKTDHPLSTPLVGWVVPHPQARIVTLTLGHGPTAYANAAFRTLLQQAIWWAGRRDP